MCFRVSGGSGRRSSGAWAHGRVDRARRVHEGLDEVVRDPCAAFLEGLNELLELVDRHLFQLAREQLAGSVVLSSARDAVSVFHSTALGKQYELTDSGKLVEELVVFLEKGEVLVRDVNVRVAAEPALLLGRFLTAAERVRVDLLLDLGGRVGHVDARVLVRGGHLGLGAGERGNEGRVDERRLAVLEPLRDLARQPEVRVLVDRARDQGWDVGIGAKDLRERVGKGGCSLDRDKVPLANVVPFQALLEVGMIT